MNEHSFNDIQDQLHKLTETLTTFVQQGQVRPGNNHIDDKIAHLSTSLAAIADSIEVKYRQIEKLAIVTESINRGLLLDEILQDIFEHFKTIIPYNRIGLALLDSDGTTLRARWAQSDKPDSLHLGIGYTSKIINSSLANIIKTHEPRVLNDLEQYLAHNPASVSTRLVVREGLRSSLTCPLIANGNPIGFIFFSSYSPYKYQNAHVEIYKRIANQLSVIIEKSRLVTEISERSQEIERKNEELTRLNELKNQFMGMAAHDLRGPLNNIRLISELLADPTEHLAEQDRVRFLNSIKNLSEHMFNMIDDLLDLTRIESGKLEIAPGAIEIDTLIADAIVDQSPLVASKQMQITTSEPCHALIHADYKRIRQVLDNLISNAIKYSPRGSKIEISVSLAQDLARISVKDQGPGLTDEDKQNLFQEFRRLSAKPTAGERCCGLGLAIAKKIIIAHNGEIGVDSQVGKGSSFWFSVPRASE